MLRFGVAVPEPHAASTSSHGRRKAASTQQQPQPKQQRSPQRGGEDDVDDVEATKAKLRDTVQRAQWHDPDAAWGGDPSSDTSTTRHGGDPSDATTSGTDVGGSTTSGTRYSSGHGEARAMSMRLAGMSPPRRGWGAPTVHDSGPRRVVQPTMRLYTSAQPHDDDHGRPKRRRHRRGSTSSSSGRARSRVAKGSKRRLASKGRRRQRQDEAVAVPSSLLVFGL